MKNRPTLALLCFLIAVVSCTGVPIRSLPRLAKLQTDLMQGDLTELIVAIQVDARMVPPEGRSPLLSIAIKPADPSGFEAVERKLPMNFVTSSSATLGLEPPGKGRRWLIYSLTKESQVELEHLRETFKQIRTGGTKPRGGTLSIGIEQQEIAAKDPALANTEWSSWLQTSRREGFFELWSGKVGDVAKQGNQRKE